MGVWQGLSSLASEQFAADERGSSSAPRANLRLEAAAIIGVWLVAAAIFFRSDWSGGFQHLLGDNHDTVFITYVEEHWFQVFHGMASWRSPATFYPTTGLLGSSEGFLLFEAFYAPLRLLGFDRFMAAELSVVLFSLVGFASFVCLVRIAFAAQRWIALIGGLAFTFANNLWLHVYWTQLLAVWMVPPILLLGVLAFRAAPEHRVRSLALGAACGLGAALLFLTGFYIAWFSTLAAGVACSIHLITSPRRAWDGVRRTVQGTGWLVPVMGVTFAVGMVPFFAVYLPAQSTVKHLTYGEIMLAAPRVHDLLNVGADNVMWTSVIHRALPAMSAWSALTYAVTPLLMVLAVIGSAAALWTSRKQGGRAASAAKWAAVLAATAVVLSILPVSTDFGSLWRIVWHVPGATAIRRTNRLEVVTGLVAVAGAGDRRQRAVPARPARRSHHKIWRTVIVGLVLLTAVEQYNVTPMDGLDRSAQLALLRSSTAPPTKCRSFYVVDRTHPSIAEAYAVAVTDQLDAMSISERYSIPTLNGYTGYTPKGWNLLNPFSPDYLAAVRTWAEAHDLQSGLCQLDLDTMRWTTRPARAGALAEAPN